MKIGQMTLPRVSEASDFIQLDICGLSPMESLDRYVSYRTSKPVVLHGDWTKKGASENDLLKERRQEEYVKIVELLNKVTEVIGFTLHPPFRSKCDVDTLIDIKSLLEKETKIPFFVENRSNHRILASKPEEVIEMSNLSIMTIDIPQLYISCRYSEETMLETLSQLNKKNINEVHFANIMRKDGRSYVARKLEDGVLDLKKVIPFIKDIPLVTLEILGGNKAFESQQELLLKWIEDSE